MPSTISPSPYSATASELALMFSLVAKAAKPVLGVVAVIAGIDVAVTHWRYLKNMKERAEAGSAPSIFGSVTKSSLTACQAATPAGKKG